MSWRRAIYRYGWYFPAAACVYILVMMACGFVLAVIERDNAGAVRAGTGLVVCVAVCLFVLLTKNRAAVMALIAAMLGVAFALAILQHDRAGALGAGTLLVVLVAGCLFDLIKNDR